MRAPGILILVLASCAGPQPDPEPARDPGAEAAAAKKPAPAKKPSSKASKPAPAKKPTPTGLPDGFAVKGRPVIVEPRLGPDQTWRQLVGKLTTLRVDVRMSGKDLLVTLDPDAFHVTDRSGRRETWRFPPGLRLSSRAHVLLKADLSTRIYGANGAQVPTADEITVVTGTVDGADQFRLVVKGGRTFRSISNPG